jgi:hypothetical protein
MPLDPAALTPGSGTRPWKAGLLKSCLFEGGPCKGGGRLFQTAENILYSDKRNIPQPDGCVFVAAHCPGRICYLP